MSKLSYSVNATFHPVGEGLFSSLDFLLPRCDSISRFSMVYDCGSLSSGTIRRRVHVYTRNRRILDLLVISHLHYDHVSGLINLFEKLTINTVMLPYLSPLERLLTAALQPEEPTWYYMFLADPISFLASLGAKRIILIFGGEHHREFGLPGSPSPKEDGFRLDTSWLNKIDKEKLEEIRNVEVLRDIERVECYYAVGTAFIIACGKPIAKIIPFLKSVKLENIEEFRKCICKKIFEGFFCEPPYIVKSTDLIKILTDREKRRKLKECYEELFPRRLNLTSLVIWINLAGRVLELYAGYIADNKELVRLLNISRENPYIFISYPYEMLKYFPRYSLYDSSLSIVLTGDLPLREVSSEFHSYFNGLIDTIKVFQIPHHGSEDSFHETFRLGPCPAAALSYGLWNRYGHPSYEALDFYNENAGRIFHVTEVSGARFAGRIHLDYARALI
jgi:hypothetical protein